MALKVPDAVEKQSDWTHRRQVRIKAVDDAIGSSVEAIRRVFLDSYEELIRHARRRVESPEIAQDLVQQAFANTLSAVENGVQVNNMKGFLHRCVHNLCVNHSLQQPHYSIEEEVRDIAETSTETSAELRERWREVSAAVNRLSPILRDVFVLTELKGLSNDEVAERLDRSVNAVRQLLYRARRDIRANVGSGSDWVGISIPVVGLEQFLMRSQPAKYEKLITWVKAKFAEVNSWLGNIMQLGPDSLIHPQIAVAVSAVVVALATIATPPYSERTRHEPDSYAIHVQSPKYSSVESHRVLADSQKNQPVNVPSVNGNENSPRRDPNTESADREKERKHGDDGFNGKEKRVDPEAVAANNPPTNQPKPGDGSASPPYEATTQDSGTYRDPEPVGGPGGGSNGPDMEISEEDPGFSAEQSGQKGSAGGGGQPVSDDDDGVDGEIDPDMEVQLPKSVDIENIAAPGGAQQSAQ